MSNGTVRILRLEDECRKYRAEIARLTAEVEKLTRTMDAEAARQKPIAARMNAEIEHLRAELKCADGQIAERDEHIQRLRRVIDSLKRRGGAPHDQEKGTAD
jgi:predicted RNase H-like nuclease (RuvC/YqgF family)